MSNRTPESDEQEKNQQKPEPDAQKKETPLTASPPENPNPE